MKKFINTFYNVVRSEVNNFCELTELADGNFSGHVYYMSATKELSFEIWESDHGYVAVIAEDDEGFHTIVDPFHKMDWEQLSKILQKPSILTKGFKGALNIYNMFDALGEID